MDQRATKKTREPGLKGRPVVGVGWGGTELLTDTKCTLNIIRETRVRPHLLRESEQMLILADILGPQREKMGYYRRMDMS